MAKNKVNTTNGEEKKKKKKLFIIFGSILGAGAIATAIAVPCVLLGGGGNPVVTPYKVSASLIEQVSGWTIKVAPKTINPNTEYVGEISMEQIEGQPQQACSLPTTLTGDDGWVKVGKKSFTEFTYQRNEDETTAKFKIPAESVTGDIEVGVRLIPDVPPPPIEDEFEFDFAGVGCISNNDSFKAPAGRYEFTITSTEEGGTLNDNLSEITIDGVSIVKDKSKYTYQKISNEQAKVTINDVTGDLYIEAHSHNQEPLPTLRVTYQVPETIPGEEDKTLIKFYVPAQEGETVKFQHDSDEKVEVTDGFVEYNFASEASKSIHTLTIYGNIDSINTEDEEFKPYGYGATSIYKCELMRDFGKPHEYSTISVADYDSGVQTLVSEVAIADGVVTLPYGLLKVNCYSSEAISSNNVLIEIPDSVQRINEEGLTVSFYYYEGVITENVYVKLNSNVKYIESRGVVMESNYNNESNYVVLYTSLKEIPDNYKCDWVSLFYSHLMLDCSNPPTKHTSSDNYLYYLSDSGEASLYSYVGSPITTENYNIPEYVDNHIVTSLNADFKSKSTFGGGSPINLVLPSGLKYIFDRAFSYDTSVTGISFKDGPENSQLEYIGSEVFSNDHLVSNIVIPDSVKRIGELAFGYTKPEVALDPFSLSLPQNLIYLGNRAFAGANISKITFPKSLSYIGNRAVSECPLESIEIDDDNPYYSDCDMNIVYEIKTKKVLKGLKDFTLPEGVAEIGESAYSHITFDKDIVIPKTVTKIDDCAFESTIPGLSFEENSALKYIGEEAFAQSWDGKYTGIAGEVILPEGLTFIANGAFSKNLNISKIYLPDSLKDGYVGSYVFENWTINQTISYPKPTPGCWDEYWNMSCNAQMQERTSR